MEKYIIYDSVIFFDVSGYWQNFKLLFLPRSHMRKFIQTFALLYKQLLKHRQEYNVQKGISKTFALSVLGVFGGKKD